MQYPGKAITDQYPTRSLCGKRLDNSLPFTSSYSGSLHTCFEDVVLVPLASWVFLLALVGYVFYVIASARRGTSSHKQPYHRLIHRKQTVIDDKERDEALMHSSGATSHTRTTRRPKTHTFLSILYSLLIIATLLMNILEIVRLYLADRGAGLLPFTLASIVIILILMHTPMPAQVRAATGIVILIFWVLSLVFTSVQLATLTALSNVEPRTATEYLNSDQIIDVSVIVALYALEVIVEFARLMHFRRLSR